jgi:histone H2A
MDEQQQKTNIVAKKKTHFFETYISKLLKNIAPQNGITSNAKQQLNSFLCFFIKTIASTINDLTIIAKKKTISTKEVENSLNIILMGELRNLCINEGKKACDSFSSHDNKGSKQTRANIVFPPSMIEKFLRNFGYSKIMVANLAPVYLAAVLEFITYEILDISVNYCNQGKHVRITVRDMELAVRNDVELHALFKKLNISFLGGGVVPFIHSSLLVKKNKKKTVPKKDTHRYRYGTMALKNIKKQQKQSDSLVLSKSPFEKLVRQIIKNNLDENVKISKDVFTILQYFIEQYIIDILYHSNYLTIHAGRVKLLPVDIQLYNSFQNHNNISSLNKNPYITNDTINLLSMDNNDENEN